MGKSRFTVDHDKAQRLRDKAQGMGTPLTHAQAQELVACVYGDENWAALRARRQKEASAQAKASEGSTAPTGASTAVAAASLEAPVARDVSTDLLAICATALRDLAVGYHPRDIIANSGEGLPTLLHDVVTHLRGMGVDDEGAWDTEKTRDIAVARVGDASRDDEAWVRNFARELYALGLSDEDLDEAVHEHIGGPRASRINNDGLAAQLLALLDQPGLGETARRQSLRELVQNAAQEHRLPDAALERIARVSLR